MLTRNVVLTLVQLFVAVTVTVVVPTENERGDVITVVPILYTKVGDGEPVTVTFGPKLIDVLQLFKVAELLILLAVTVGAVFTTKATALEVAGGVQVPLITTLKFPAMPVAGLVMVNVGVVTFEYGAALVMFTPFLLH